MMVSQLVGPTDDKSSKEKLEACKQFLVDSEMEIGRCRLFIFAMDILNGNKLSQKLDTVVEKLKRAAKKNISSDFLLKNVEDGNCR